MELRKMVCRHILCLNILLKSMFEITLAFRRGLTFTAKKKKNTRTGSKMMISKVFRGIWFD